MAGPVIQDASRALEKRDGTPVLKWVREKDEKVVKTAFAKALAARDKKSGEKAGQEFLSTLVRIHRAGEGEPLSPPSPLQTGRWPEVPPKA